jgi:hypothetical protein
VWGCGGIAPQFLTSALDEGEWSASCPGCFTYWTRCWVDPRAGIDTVEKRKISCPCQVSTFFLARLVGGGVQLGPLGTSVTNWPTVPALCDYDGEFGGMMIGRVSRSTQRKPAPVSFCPPQIPHDLTRFEPGPPW